jgi:membrane associated rhomboid family serine protease
MVLRLLIINVVVFFLQLLAYEGMLAWFAVIPSAWWQPWRYLTFQFLHGDIMHILFNMIGLYFLGGILESGLGSKRFLIFYLACGAFAGVSHVIMSYALGWNSGVPLLGASGGVYAILLACAVYFPQVRVILFLFPMPIRTAAVLLGLVALYFTFSEAFGPGGGSGGVSHVAHLGGAVAAAAYIWGWPLLRGRLKLSGPRGRGRWERKVRRQQRSDQEIDRILTKIRREGIGSLSRGEKEALREATEEQQREQRNR